MSDKTKIKKSKMSDCEDDDKIPTTTVDFLKKYRIKNKNDPNCPLITHTAIPNPGVRSGGSYHIPSELREEFLKVYHNDVINNRQLFHLTERHHPEVSPILIDLDFRQKPEDNPNQNRLYTQENIKTFLEVYVDILKQYIDESELLGRCEAFVMEKKMDKAQKSKSQLKDGVHIMFPKLCPAYKIQFLARYDLVENEKIQQLFKDMKLSNTARDIVDHSVIKQNGWFMYGSSKPGSCPYQVTNIYDFSFDKCKNVPLTKYRDQEKLMDLLSISNKRDTTPIKFGIEDSVRQKYNSIPERDRDADHRDSRGHTSNKSTGRKSKSLSNLNRNKIDDQDLELVKRLVLECLNSRRADNFEEWIRVCWCLSNTDYRLEKTFIEFSKKSTNGKFDKPGCEDAWAKSQERIHERKLGLGTLHKWAREDNPKKYESICGESLRTLLKKSLSGDDTDIARYVYEKYKHLFKCGSIIHGSWYMFKDHRWMRNDKACDLRKKISKDVVWDYHLYDREVQDEAHKANSEDDDSVPYDPKKELSGNLSKKIHEVQRKLKNNTTKNRIINECCELFYDETFEEELDSNNNLLHFLNGVYDLDTDEFREGYPEDNISLSTNINYIEELDAEDNEKIMLIEDFFEKVHPDEEIRKYILTLFASFLHGSNKDQKFHIWTGVGSNGKSLVIDFFKNTIGDYYGSMSITSLTKGRGGSENASPVLAETKGKRFISLDEAESNDEIKVGFMKQLTGGDEITARKLHSSPITFKPKFKIVLTCNELPNIPSDDGGTWRRIRVVNHESRFCDDPDPKKSNEFLIDRSLPDYINEWCEAFMYMLLKYFAQYRTHGIHEPYKVKKYTEAYRKDNDLFTQFKDDYLCEDSRSAITMDDIFPIFKGFINEEGHDPKKYNRKEVLKGLEKPKILGKANGRNKKWRGWRILTNEDNQDDDDGNTTESEKK